MTGRTASMPTTVNGASAVLRLDTLPLLRKRTLLRQVLRLGLAAAARYSGSMRRRHRPPRRWYGNMCSAVRAMAASRSLSLQLFRHAQLCTAGAGIFLAPLPRVAMMGFFVRTSNLRRCCRRRRPGKFGGQVQPFAASAIAFFTIRSSSEWNVMTASRPPGFKRVDCVRASSRLTAPSSSLTAMRIA